MSVRVWWPAIVALAVCAMAAPVAAYADEGEDDHEVARELHRRGDIKSLEDILRDLKQTNPGDVVAIGLIKLSDRWVYQIQVVAPDGHRSVVSVDAGPIVSMDEGGDD